MEPHVKSNSFIFKKDLFRGKNCRAKLQDRFNASEASGASQGNRSIFSVVSLGETRRALQRISKGFGELRTSIGSFSQRFRLTTKRRQILEEGPVTPGCATPHTYSKAVLGRTPTKLYSPFSIDSPYNKPLTSKIR